MRKGIDSLFTPEAADYAYVRDATALSGLIRCIEDGERVAFDIEADSLHSYTEKVCLLQLSVGGRHFVVDPLSELDFGGLVQALADKPLIAHGGDYDLRMLRAWRGFRPRGEVFDTMIAAQLLGIEQIGLAALVERFLDIAMTKDSQKSDWSRRPLSEKQLRYAANDTRHLEGLAECLRGELLERGRVEWHRESCRAMVDATGRDRPRDSREAWRIKGAGRLTPRQLAYLREIWGWREERARAPTARPSKCWATVSFWSLCSGRSPIRASRWRRGRSCRATSSARAGARSSMRSTGRRR